MTHHLPNGFRYAGSACGIKQQQGCKDISLIVSDVPAVAAGVYTQNQVVAAPVVLCRQVTPSSCARAIVTNSGNANACTGVQGQRDAESMRRQVADLVGCEAAQCLVMSTGIIGHHLPMDKIEAGITQAMRVLAYGESAFLDAADGILTTDNGRKTATAQIDVAGRRVNLVGMAKGAGMIGPNMATMLGAIMTDACLTTDQAQSVLGSAVGRSFNCISVEGHTSTNDTVLLLANGQSETGAMEGESLAAFETALTVLCIELAKKIPTDGEGASHLMEITVRGAANDEDAQQICRAVAASNLVKTAVYGNDPNWGRIVSAAGYAGPKLEMSHLQLRLNGILLFDQGEPIEFDETAASRSIAESATTLIELQVGNGRGCSTHWASDLTVKYVEFNSEYTT